MMFTERIGVKMSAWKGVYVCFFVLRICFSPSAAQNSGRNCTCGAVGTPCVETRVCADTTTNICNIENVALRKPAAMKSDPGAWGHVSCLAVNGNTSTFFDEGTNKTCAETGPRDYSAWWLVDLSQAYIITNITIYRRAGWARRMSDIEMRVDNQLCHKFPPHTNLTALDALPEKIDIQCDPPLTGRIVKLQKVDTSTEQQYNGFHFINVCEVQVWGCASGFFGKDCSACGHCTESSTCNVVTGECPGGCQAGWQGENCNQTCADGTYGQNCSSQCRQCVKGSTCSKATGECPAGCQAGYQGAKCEEECKSGTYGRNCSSQCGQCADGSTCNKTTGECPAGCQSGWQGTYCNQTCSGGTYGPGCKSKCGQCTEGSTCNRTTGKCPAGCQSGWQQPNCNTCVDNYYGLDCTFVCGHCKDITCNNATGVCGNGCENGYYGVLCKSACGNCKNILCNNMTGHCEDGCEDGYYNVTCKEPCGHCSNGNTCHPITGACEKGCDAGYYGMSCRRECNSCSDGSACSSTTGLCPEDAAPFGGPLRNNVGVIVGPVIAGVMLLIIVTVIVVVVVRRQRRTTRKPPSDDLGEHTSGAVNPGFHDNPFSSVSTARAEPKESKKAKPQADVKPTFVKPQSTGDAHIYMNQYVQEEHCPPEAHSPPSHSAPSDDSWASAADSASASQPQSTARASVSRARQPSRPPVAARTMGTSTTRSEVEDDFTTESEFQLYQNDDELYATFKASRPELDSVQKYLVDRLASGQLPHTFADLATGADLPRDVANLDVNYKKNRFASVQPYDTNRVVLHDGYQRDGATDFVNASYISGYTAERAYIAAQGPRDNTVADFWRIVWQEGITHIIMLTNVIESGKNKCSEYWPAVKCRQIHGPIAVTGMSVENRASYTIRTFKTKSAGGHEEREVTQYHYVSWPDHGAPDTTALIMFWRFVMARVRQNSNAPLLIHCSAGVGRTGTFIGLDLGFQVAVREKKIDVVDLVARMREERCWMVQAAEQFVFLHKVMLEAYTARDTFRSAGEFVTTFTQPISIASPHTRIDAEFKTLVQMRSLSPKQTYDSAENDDNITKNRNPDVLPADDHLVYLTENLPGRNQYINAVYMSTFWRERGCILTQLPLPNTLVDFWRLVYGDSVHTIVSLASRGEEQEVTPYCWYWPRSEHGAIQTGPYTVRLQSKTQTGSRTASYTLRLDKEGEATSRDVRVLRYEDWTGEVPANTSDLLHLVDALDNARSDGKGSPFIVQCSDGVSKSGLFSVVCDVIHQLRCDLAADVYMAVRHVQSVRPQAVTSEIQYRYLYDLVQRQAGEMSVYANA